MHLKIVRGQIKGDYNKLCIDNKCTEVNKLRKQCNYSLFSF